MLNLDSKKVVIKIFDRKNSTEKRPHTCSTCGIYKREIEKGNREALEFYEAQMLAKTYLNIGPKNARKRRAGGASEGKAKKKES